MRPPICPTDPGSALIRVLHAPTLLPLLVCIVCGGAAPTRQAPLGFVRLHAAHRAHAAAEARRAQAETAGRLAASRADQDAARAAAISAQARDAAARLRDTETRAADTCARLDRLRARRQALQAELAHDGAALEAMLPLIERLSLYPAETLLGSQAPPAESLSGLMVLRGLGAELESRAGRLRARQLELARTDASLQTQKSALAVLREEQAARGRVVASAAEDAAAQQRASRDAADAAFRRAAESASRAASLGDAVARIEAAQHEAEARFQREAAAADRARRPGRAQTARANAAAFNPAPGSAPETVHAGAFAATLAAPVAGRLVQAWGASTDAGPASGITYAPPPLAVVTAPCGGRIDFAGPFRSYGKMLILDCGHGYRFVLAGLGGLDVAIGQRLARGVAVGRMPDWAAGGAGGRPSLYVQLRNGDRAIDPGGFLRDRS